MKFVVKKTIKIAKKKRYRDKGHLACRAIPPWLNAEGFSNELMKKYFSGVFAIAAISSLTACGNLNTALAARHEVIEMYHIFDVKTGSSPDTVIKAAADGLARNSNSVVQNRPLQMGAKIPAEPARFELVNMADAFKGTGMGAMLSMAGGAGGATMRVAKCDSAVWSSKAVRNISGSSNLTLYSCLYRYKSGYSLNMYAVFQKTSGGLNGLVTNAASAMVGTPEQWLNKTIIDTVRSIEVATNSRMTRIEGQPELGALPSVDQMGAR